MNNSQRTKVVCQGISLYADVMDEPVLLNTPARRVWEDFQKRFPEYVEYIQLTQHRIFDQLNEKF